ncbi:MAG: hypothetical protein WCT11_04230 [Candidatus Magasanikbacteria bacterium]
MEVSAEKQFKESKSRNFLYFGLVLFSVFVFGIFGYLNFVSAATPPSIVTYQGKILVGGVAPSEDLAIMYVLYDAASGGNALYTAAGTTSSPLTFRTTVSNGFFTTDLGGAGTNALDSAIFRDNQTVYLEVSFVSGVVTETLSPRKRITASPFAINSMYLNGIGASSTPQSSSYIPISDSSGNLNFNNVTSTGVYVSGNTTIGGLLSVVGNSYFGTIASGTWSGGVISNAVGGIGQNSSAWNGFVKVTGGTWSTSTISVGDLSNSSTLAFLAGNQTFSGLNIFSATTTFASSTFSGYVGIGTTTPLARLHVNGGNILHTAFGNPTLKSSLTTSNAYGVYVANKYAYVADFTDGLKIIDISNSASPTLTATLSTTNPQGVYVSGRYAYVADANSGLRIIDISNSASPTLIGTLATTNAFGVYVSGKYAYVADTTDGLRIIDISKPNTPSLLSSVSTTNAYGVYVSGKYAYVADGNSGLRIIDISKPSSPTIVGSVTTTYAWGVYVSGKYAYVADDTAGLKIIDISNPATPTTTGIFDTVSAEGVYVSGNYAYVADLAGGLKTIDISNPASPTLVGALSTVNAYGVFVSGKYAYVAGMSGGLQIVDINGMETPAMSAGNIATNDLTVYENVDIGNSLNVRNGLNLGTGGIFSTGPVAINVSSTQGTIFSISTNTASGVSFFNVDSNGTVKINTTTAFGLSFSYKLLIDAGATSSGAIGTNGFIRATSYISGTTTLDIAETYPINMLCAANGTCPINGDLVCTDPTVVAGVKKCSAGESDRMIGIVSTNPGFLLGGGDLFDPNQNLGIVKVALAGRVPTKVSSINGEINAGDKLTLSSIDGVAAKAVGEVPIVGIAMESFSGNGEGEIIVFVNLGWQNQVYQSLTVNTNSSTLTVGSDITPYNLLLSGEFTMFNSVLNKLVFNATALFESNTNDSHAFIFNAINFGTSTDKYLLSLRSNSVPRFSVMANGDVRASGNIYAASAVFGTSSNPGDLAERVDIASDDIVEPGDVLVVDMNNPDTYRRSSGANQQAVAGVVSTNPTIVVGNGKTEYTSVMAMVGRVPLKVSDENGAIGRGDLLVTASSTGYAMKYDSKKDNDNQMVGVVGIALDPFTGGKGKIMALVRTGWVNSHYETISSIKDNIQQLAVAQGIVLGATSTINLNVENNKGQLTYSGGDLNLQGSMLLNVASVSGKNNRWSIDESGHFITKINTSQGEKDMYAMQSPTSEFVFSSSSQLIAGEVKVMFDQTMQDVIDSDQPLKINITLTSGEAKGIYVSEKNSQGFTVKELEGGTSSATFDWMVVAKRKEEVTSLNVVDVPVPVDGGQTLNDVVTSSTTVSTATSTNINEIPNQSPELIPTASAPDAPVAVPDVGATNPDSTPVVTPPPSSDLVPTETQI